MRRRVLPPRARRPHGRRVAVALVLGSLGFVVGTTLASPGGAQGVEILSGRGVASTTTASVADRSFAIAGSVHGLYPGVTLALPLTVTNGKAFALTLESITTSVANPSTSCGAGNVTVTAFSGHRTIPARGHVVVDVAVSMRHAAPNACEGAIFLFTYSGRAVAS